MGSNWTDKALRKLDALCAEHVFGWSWWEREAHGTTLKAIFPPDENDRANWGECFEPAKNDTNTFSDWDRSLKHYSTQWDHAGEVVEKMRALPVMERFRFPVELRRATKRLEQGENDGFLLEYEAVVLWQSPLAITLAAVAACSGKTVEEIMEECNAN